MKVEGMGRRNISALQNNQPKTPEEISQAKSVLQFIVDLRKNKKYIAKPKTPEELEQRFTEYFEKCSTEGQPPTFEALSLVSGWCYTTFYDISEGKMCTEFTNVIKKAKDVCRIYDSQMATNGKVLAPVYIFRAKNFYGMRDEQKVQIEAKTDIDKPENTEKILDALPEAPNEFLEGDLNLDE